MVREGSPGRCRWRGRARKNRHDASGVWWSQVAVALFEAVQHGTSGDILEGRLEVEGGQDSGGVSFGEELDGFDHFVGSIQARHSVMQRAGTNGFLAAMTALIASRRKNDNMRSG